MSGDIAVLGAAKTDPATGAPLWQTVVPITDDTTDVETLGDADVYQGLGLSSMPWPLDSAGHAEAVILRNCGNRDAVCVGARDTRSARIVGNLKPGDTVVHSTGPNQAAQLQLKEAKRQAVLATQDEAGRTMATILDGKNRKVQVAYKGAIIEIDPDGNISLTAGTGGSILIQDGTICLLGKVILGGKNPSAPVLGGTPPGTPIPGVFFGS